VFINYQLFYAAYSLNANLTSLGT